MPKVSAATAAMQSRLDKQDAVLAALMESMNSIAGVVKSRAETANPLPTVPDPNTAKAIAEAERAEAKAATPAIPKRVRVDKRERDVDTYVQQKGKPEEKGAKKKLYLDDANRAALRASLSSKADQITLKAFLPDGTPCGTMTMKIRQSSWYAKVDGSHERQLQYGIEGPELFIPTGNPDQFAKIEASGLWFTVKEVLGAQ